MLSRLKEDIEFCISTGRGLARGGVTKRLPFGGRIHYPFHWMVYGMCFVHPQSTMGVKWWFSPLRWVLTYIDLVSWRIMNLNGLIGR